MNRTRVWAIARKEAIQLRRDRRSMILAFLLPAALILFFGFAITFDVKNIELVVLDQDRTAETRRLVDSFTSSGYFEVVGYVDRAGDVDQALARGDARVALTINPGFTADLVSGRGARLQLILDGGDANTATIAMGYAETIISRFNLTPSSGAANAPIRLHSRIWYNETLESVNMIVPGLIAVIMSIIAAMLTALTIAREWERGTMEQLAATPVRRSEVVLGKLLPYVGIGLADVILAVVAGRLVFGVPVRGDLVSFAVLTLLFLVGALGLGMFLSAALKSQLLATQAAMLTTYLPALLLSGFLFSIANMPFALRAITFVVPARYYITVTRGIFLKGHSIVDLMPQALALTLFAIIGVSLATVMFRKEIA